VLAEDKHPRLRNFLTNLLVASRPLMYGMLMSIMMTSGSSALAAATASIPLAASPHISRSAADSTSERRPLRKISWSSTISKRVRANSFPEGMTRVAEYVHRVCVPFPRRLERRYARDGL